MKILAVIFIVIFSLLLGSCRKCTNCSYEYTDESGVDYSYSYDEYCNSKKDLESFEEMVKNQASDLGGTYECKE